MKKSIYTLLAVGIFLLSIPVQASTWVGTTNNVDGAKWSVSANWSGGLPSVGDTLTFPSAAIRRNPINNDLSGLQINSLNLMDDDFWLNGSLIQLSNGILSSQATGTNVINLPLTLTGDQAFTVQNNGASLVFEPNGDISLGSNELTIGGLGGTFIKSTIDGTGGIVKLGPGFLRFEGGNSYSGGTVISGGAFEVTNATGTATGNGPVIIENGAELQGNGRIDGAVTVEAGGEISPGDNRPALLKVGSLDLNPDSVFIVQLNGPVPGGSNPDIAYSGLDVVGSVSIGGAIFRIALGPDLVSGDEFIIIDNDSTDDVVGTFNNLSEGETFRVVGVDDIGFKITYNGGDGNDVVLTSIPTLSINDISVVEPSSGTVTATFVVTLSDESDETIEVDYSTAAGTATTPADYTVASGTLTFAPGTTTQTIQVTVKADAITEGNEEFFLNLFSPTNASIAKDEGVATILPPGSTPPGPGGPNPNPNPNPSTPTGSDGGCSLGHGAEASSAVGIFLMAGLLLAFSWGRRKLNH